MLIESLLMQLVPTKAVPTKTNKTTTNKSVKKTNKSLPIKSLESLKFIVLAVFFIASASVAPSSSVASASVASSESVASVSDALQCSGLLAAERSPYRIPKTVRIMSYNVQDFYVQKGHHIRGNGKKKVKVNPRAKEERHTQEIARIITELSPDLIVLQEVETWNSLNRFIGNYLGGEYVAFMSGDHDTREKNIAFLIKNDLDFHVRVKPVGYLTWKAPSGNTEPVFSRELGIFEVFDSESKKMVLGVFGVHYKSHKDRKNDPRSFLKRSQEAENTSQIVEKFLMSNPNTPFIIAGDFNSNPNDPELSSLFKNLSVLNPIHHPNLFKNSSGLGLYTHSFHQKGSSESVYSEVDFILTSNDLERFILGVDIYRYKDRDHNIVKPLPDDNKERNENPSDHFPVFIDIKPEVFYPIDESH